MSAETIDPAVTRQFEDGEKRFRWMGSPLYSAFCRRALEDENLLALAAEAPPGQPFTHLLFAAVHSLLLEDNSVPLAAFYPSVTKAPNHDFDEAFEMFRLFCQERRGEIVYIMKTRTVQFTVAGRAAFVLLAVVHVARLAGEPLSLIDIGCSAGLLTAFDHYAYDFGTGHQIGQSRTLTITSFRLLGAPPELPNDIPKIGQRVGIDLNPIDPADPTERRWIDALCPPDMVEERRQLRAALDFRAHTPLRVVKGDALMAMPDLLSSMPDPICILATHCLYQWPQEAREALDTVLRKASLGRSLYRVAIDHPAALDPSRASPDLSMNSDESPIEHEAILRVFRDGAASDTLLGRYDSFGRKGVWLV